MTTTNRSKSDGFAKSIMNMFIKFITILLPAKHVADPREVAAIVERAWIDNVEAYGLGGARAFAHKVFNEVVSAYVVAYHDRTGTFPCGDHDVLATDRKLIYFAPRPILFSNGSPLLAR